MNDKRIGFGERFGAHLLDVVINSVAGFVFVGGAFVVGLILSVLVGPEALPLITGLGVLIWLLGWFILVGLEVITEAALGKRIVGLRIRNFDCSPSTFWQRLLRFVIKQLWLFAGIIAAALGASDDVGRVIIGVALAIQFGGSLMVFGKEKQTLYDLAAKTAVFTRKDIIAYEEGKFDSPENAPVEPAEEG